MAKQTQDDGKPRSVALVPIDKIRDLLVRQQSELQKALPEHLQADTFLRIALTECQKNVGLLECTPRSLVGALFQAAQLGLYVDSTLGHAYLVPFGGVVTLIPGYKGLCSMAYRSGLVSSFGAVVVRKDDVFEWEEGTNPRIVHKPKLVTKIPEDELHGVVGCYARALMKDGTPAFIFMSRAEIEARRNRSPAWKKKKNTPWLTDPVAMFKKTPTRDLCKWLPASTEQLQTAVALDERAETGLPQNLDLFAPRGVIDIETDNKLDKLAASMPEPADD